MNKYQGQYKEFRKDGWPLCPNCGEDELWTRLTWHQMLGTPKPSIDEYINDGLQCYWCSFKSIEVNEFQGLINQT